MPLAVSSFPTRPSSDLPAVVLVVHHAVFGQQLQIHLRIDGAEQFARLEREFERGAADVIEQDHRLVGVDARVLRRCVREELRRSEEHTSELQSPCQLVCPSPSHLSLHDPLPISQRSFSLCTTPSSDSSCRYTCGSTGPNSSRAWNGSSNAAQRM